MLPGSSPVLSLAPLPGGGFLCGTGNPECGVTAWSLPQGGDARRLRSHPKAHGDAVRCVAFAPEAGGVLSASHDCTAKLWSPDGACLATYEGHTALLYCVAPQPGGAVVATGSEDGTARVWRASGEPLACLRHPACVWALAWTPAGELVTACGDGVARVWTRGAGRGDARLTSALADSLRASDAAATAAASEAASSAPGPPAGVKLLPRAALAVAGTRDGATIVVSEGSAGVAYSWSAASSSWERIGEVVGAAGGAAPASFTFDVDVADGAPPRKLTYAPPSNPADVAEAWLEAEGLPPGYKQQIIEFIIRNTGGEGGPAAAAFAAAASTNFDPFTGGGSYVPAPPSAPAPPPPRPLVYLPATVPVRFDAASVDGMRSKLALFGADAASLEPLLVAASAGVRCASLPPDAAALVAPLLSWPIDRLFPVLDLLRLCCVSAPGCALVGDDSLLVPLLSALRSAAAPDAPVPAAVTGLRFMANALASPSLSVLCSAHLRPLLFDCFAASPACSYPLVRTAFATALLNSAIGCAKAGGDDAAVCVSASVAAAATTSAEDDDALFRALVAIGTLAHASAESKHLAEQMGAADVAREAKQRAGNGKAGIAADDLLQVLGAAGK